MILSFLLRNLEKLLYIYRNCYVSEEGVSVTFSLGNISVIS